MGYSQSADEIIKIYIYILYNQELEHKDISKYLQGYINKPLSWDRQNEHINSKSN